MTKMTKTTKLHFELYEYGDPYLQAMVDDKDAYTIEQAGKFELRYTKFGEDTIILGRYNTIYEVLDAANAHAERPRLMPFKDLDLYDDKVAPQADEFIMPLRQELEVFEDNQPSDRPPCRLYGQVFQ